MKLSHHKDPQYGFCPKCGKIIVVTEKGNCKRHFLPSGERCTNSKPAINDRVFTVSVSADVVMALAREIDRHEMFGDLMGYKTWAEMFSKDFLAQIIAHKK